MELFQRLTRWTMTKAPAESAAVAPAQRSPSSSEPRVVYESTPITSPRSLKQLSVFFAGAACFLASTLVTRRAIHRRHLRIKPKLFEPNTNPHEHFSPAHDAMTALHVATLNVFSLGMMTTGGILWAFDTSGLSEMQAALRGRLGIESIYQEPLHDNGTMDGSTSGTIPEKTDTDVRKMDDVRTPR